MLPALDGHCCRRGGTGPQLDQVGQAVVKIIERLEVNPLAVFVEHFFLRSLHGFHCGPGIEWRWSAQTIISAGRRVVPGRGGEQRRQVGLAALLRVGLGAQAPGIGLVRVARCAASSACRSAWASGSPSATTRLGASATMRPRASTTTAP